MPEFGYSLSSEEHEPNELVRLAARAEETGFTFALISDHYHPWVSAQGHSPFVWSVIGGIAQSTKTLRVGTGVTCPIMRIHPAVIAQAAATAAAMMEGRFFLGLGSGENLNEHVTGEAWPPPDVRHRMLCEAIEIIRLLWQGGEQRYYGEYFIADEATLYTLPKKLPPIIVAASGTQSAEFAASQDGLVSTSPQREVVKTFEKAGGRGKPKYAQIGVCWAKREAEAVKTAHHYWPTSGIPGNVNWEIKTPAMFEAITRLVTEEQIASEIVCGPDPARHIAEAKKYLDAGFDHVYFHQIGPDQEGFFRFYEREVLPELRRMGAQRRVTSAA